MGGNDEAKEGSASRAAARPAQTARQWRSGKGAVVVPYKISAAFKVKLAEMHSRRERRGLPVKTCLWPSGRGRVLDRQAAEVGAASVRGQDQDRRAMSGAGGGRPGAVPTARGDVHRGEDGGREGRRICESNRRRAALKREQNLKRERKAAELGAVGA